MGISVYFGGTNVSEQEKKKDQIAKEDVLCADSNGTRHVTLDRANRTLHHYAEGCPVAQARREAKRTSAGGGPAMVSSEGFRRGWDAVDWGKKTGGLPS
jgi:hypothetical protein